jgi:hypothetical protein
MIRLKSKNDIIYSALMVCLIEDCQQEATNLWTTESNIIDVCASHYEQLKAERDLQ